MNETRPTKPWPADAVMVVAARAGQENRAAMSGADPAVCRDCEAALRFDPQTTAAALLMPERNGRPVRFFCPPCAMTYDPRSIQILRGAFVSADRTLHQVKEPTR